MKGVIAHEWIEHHGGAERVLDAFAALYPESDIACLWADDHARYPDRVLWQSRLASGPLRRHKALALFSMSQTWRSFPTERYDWILASSYAFAHHIASSFSETESKAFIYTHTPARYIWDPSTDERGSGLAQRLASQWLRRQDTNYIANSNYAANSSFVADRIKRCWGLSAHVIYPPVSVAEIQSVSDWRTTLGTEDLALMKALPDRYVVGASRFVKYKRLDCVIKFAERCNIPAVIAGSGPLEKELVARARGAGVPVTMVVSPSTPLLRSIIQSAFAFVFPPIEDFGIIPAEAIALGTPVVVNSTGGAKEVTSGTSGGKTFDFTAMDQAADVLDRAVSCDMQSARSNVRRFSEEVFKDNIESWTGLRRGYAKGRISDYPS